MVKLADTLDLGSSSRECRFKSCYPHQKSKLFSPACEQVGEKIPSSGVRTSPRIASDPAELRREKGFFLFISGTGRRRVNQCFCIDFLFCVYNVSKSLAGRNFRRAKPEDLFRERELLRRRGPAEEMRASAPPRS